MSNPPFVEGQQDMQDMDMPSHGNSSSSRGILTHILSQWRATHNSHLFIEFSRVES